METLALPDVSLLSLSSARSALRVATLFQPPHPRPFLSVLTVPSDPSPVYYAFWVAVLCARTYCTRCTPIFLLSLMPPLPASHVLSHLENHPPCAGKRAPIRGSGCPRTLRQGPPTCMCLVVLGTPRRPRLNASRLLVDFTEPACGRYADAEEQSTDIHCRHLLFCVAVCAPPWSARMLVGI